MSRYRGMHPGTRGDGVLTTRQFVVLRDVALGFTDESIARRQQLSVDQVKSDIRSLIHHLGANSRQNAVHEAYQRRILAVDRRRKPSGICGTCGLTGATLMVDPYRADVYGENVKIMLCPTCEQRRIEDI